MLMLLNFQPYIISTIIICAITLLIYLICRHKSKQYKKRNAQNEINYPLEGIIIQLQKDVKGLNDDLEQTKNDLKQTKEELKQTKDDLKQTKEELKHTDLNFFLLENYTKQMAKNNKINSEILNVKYEYIINIYKLLLYRKISNQILEYLFSPENKVNYYKTLDLFSDENAKGKKFPIIIARVSINGIPKKRINQVIDFLMFLKEKCSSIIHFSDKSSLLQFGLLTELLGSPISSDTSKEKSTLNVQQTLSLLFGDLNLSQQNNINIMIDTQNKENYLLENIKLELNRIKEKKINEEKKDDKIDLSNYENISEDSNGNTSQSQKNGNGNNGNNVCDEINDILYHKKTQKEIIINKIEKSQTILKDIENAQIENEKLEMNLNEKNLKKNYDINFLFEEWKNAFKKGYRNDKIYQKLIKLDKNTTLKLIRDDLSKLATDLAVEIFSEDYHNFSKIIDVVIPDNELNVYDGDK